MSLPVTMRALVAPKACTTKEWEVVNMPVPKISKPDDVLIRVHACSIKTGDTQFASGHTKWIGHPMTFPFILSIEGSGEVVQVGSDVTSFRAGDAVYGAALKRPIIPFNPVGFAAEYTVIPANALLAKPAHLSWEEAAGGLGYTIVALQCFRRGLKIMGEESLEGKTVIVPAALGGAGSVGVQVAKRVYGAERVITTLSPAKIPMVEDRLGNGIIDQAVDYTKKGGLDEIEDGVADFVYATQRDTTSYFPKANKEKGVIMSISVALPAAKLREVIGGLPFWMGWIMDAMQLYYGWLLKGTGRKMEGLSGDVAVREDMEKAGEWLATGKVKTVTTMVDLEDIEGVRRESGKIAAGHGSIGVLVFKVI